MMKKSLFILFPQRPERKHKRKQRGRGRQLTKARRGIFSSAFYDSSGEMIPQWIRSQRSLENRQERETNHQNKEAITKEMVQEPLSHLFTFSLHVSVSIAWTRLLHFLYITRFYNNNVKQEKTMLSEDVICPRK